MNQCGSKQSARSLKNQDVQFLRIGSGGRFYPSPKVLDDQRANRDANAPIISYCAMIKGMRYGYAWDLLRSLVLQTADNWELVLLDTHIQDIQRIRRFKEMWSLPDSKIKFVHVVGLPKEQAWNHAWKYAKGEYVVFCNDSDVLLPQATFELTKHLNATGDNVAYSDDATFETVYNADFPSLGINGDWSMIPEKRQKISAFKPDFSIEYLRRYDYMRGLLIIKKSLLESLGGIDYSYGSAALYDLTLKLSERYTIGHIEKVLHLFRQNSERERQVDGDAGVRAVKAHLDRLGIAAVVKDIPDTGAHKLEYVTNGQPLVSIIIPNKDHVRDLRKAINSIVLKTEYKNYEIIVVENNSTQQDIFEYYKTLEQSSPSAKVEFFEGEFNFSKLVNFGRSKSKGEYLLLLNNDTEIINGSWLSEMLSLCMQNNVGAVGAMLLYPDRAIQHAGIEVGKNGEVWHVHHESKADSTGYCCNLVTVQDYSAVTGACMMTPVALFDSVAGYDGEYQVCYSDIDYCFKVREKGFRVLWTPDAKLFHYEGKTLGRNSAEGSEARFLSERTRFRELHPTLLSRDPYYNSNLSRGGDFVEFPKHCMYERVSSENPSIEDEDEPLRGSSYRERAIESMYTIARPFRSLVPIEMREKIWAALHGQSYRGGSMRIVPKPYKQGCFPDGINVFGLLTTATGLGQGARLYSKAIINAGIPHSFIDIPMKGLDALAHDEHSFDSILATVPAHNINLICINPDNDSALQTDFRRNAFDGHYNIAVWLWELEVIPEEWKQMFPLFNEIWVPSRFIYDAVVKESPLPVTLIPYGIEAPIDVTCNRASFGLPDDAFLVLAMYDEGSSASRKNPEAILDSFSEAFGKERQDVRLVLKMRPRDDESLQKTRETLSDFRNVVLITDDFSKEKTNALIACCDVFMSLHRSEGFGLVLAEAMYLGAPVVATNWSANTEFMNKEVSFLVDYEFIDVRGYHIYPNIRARWADPDVEQAANYLRLLHDDENAYRRFSEEGKQYIRNHFSIEASAKAIRKRFNEINSIDGWDTKEPQLPLPYDAARFPEGVNAYSYFEARSGLAEGARLYVRALDNQSYGHDIVNIDFLTWLNLSNDEKILSDRFVKIPQYGINIWIFNPREHVETIRRYPRIYVDGHYNIGVWLWELEDLPPAWTPCLPYVDEVWTPSTFIKAAIDKSVDCPVTVIPYGIEPKVKDGCDRGYFDLPNDKFLVLCMYDVASYMGRKNPQGSINAFFKAFGRYNANVRLVLKVNRPTNDDLKKLNEIIGECDDVILFTDSLDKQEVNSLISCCDVYISLHRSEGFGLTMAEAMYLGVPTIATNWSANTDFMNSDCACMVDYSFVPVGNEYFAGNLADGARWADADQNQAAHYLKTLYEDKDAYEHYSVAGKAYIREHLSLQISGRLMEERIREILAEHLHSNSEEAR